VRTEMSFTDSMDLAACEANIEKGGRLIVQSLVKIRDERLYRAEYGTFEEYCEIRWGMSRTHAYRLLSHGRVLDHLTADADADLSPIGDTLKESATREIANLAPETQREVIREVKRQEVKPTAKAVQAARKTVMEASGKQQIRDHFKDKNKPCAAIMLDELQRPVPDDLRLAFGTSASIQSIVGKISALIKQVDSISDQPGAEHLDVSHFRQESTALRSQLKESAYWTACPKCNGDRAGCSRCSGTGFFPKRMKGMLIAEEKAIIGMN